MMFVSKNLNFMLLNWIMSRGEFVSFWWIFAYDLNYLFCKREIYWINKINIKSLPPQKHQRNNSNGTFQVLIACKLLINKYYGWTLDANLNESWWRKMIFVCVFLKFSHRINFPKSKVFPNHGRRKSPLRLSFKLLFQHQECDQKNSMAVMKSLLKLNYAKSLKNHSLARVRHAQWGNLLSFIESCMKNLHKSTEIKITVEKNSNPRLLFTFFVENNKSDKIKSFIKTMWLFLEKCFY